MESLISDVVGEIVAYLSLVDVTRLASTSKHFQNNIWPTVKKVNMKLNNDRLRFLLSRNLANIMSLSLEDDWSTVDIHASSLHRLTNLTSLRSLAMEYDQTRLKPDILNIFTTLSQLERIKCFMDADVPALLARHKNLTDLEWLLDASISYNWSSLIQLKKLVLSAVNFPFHGTKCNIRMLTNLTSLNINDSSFQQEDIDSLTNLTNLRELKTGKNCLGPDITKYFTNLANLDAFNTQSMNIDAISTQLTKLEIFVQDVTTTMPKSSLLTNLKRLIMTNLPSESPRLSDFQFTDLKQLQKIRISEPKLIARLEAANLTNLCQLAIERPVGKAELITICQITTLQKLSIWASVPDYEAFFENVSNLVNLRSLNIDLYNNMQGRDLQLFKPEFVRFLQPLTRLTYLQFPLLVPATAKAIAVLTQLIELNVKTISESQVDLVKTFPFRVVYINASSKIK